MLAPPWLEVLDETVKGCVTYRRPDLAERLQERRAQLLDPKLRVLVIGEPNQGKSQLVNALVNAQICAVGDDLTTVSPTVIQHADTPSAVLVSHLPGGPSGAPSALAPAPQRRSVPVDEVTGRAGRDADVAATEVGIPRQLLAAGLVLVDMPAFGRFDTISALSRADAVVLASDATRELSIDELNLLVQVMQSCPNIIVALTKTDLSPEWRTITERNRELLVNAKVSARMVGVSAELRLRAAKTGDQKLNIESGFVELIGYLQQDLTTKSDRLANQFVATVSCAAIAELVVRLREDQTALVAEASSGPDSQEVQRRIEALRRRTARWQTVLSDEMAELVSDVEYDLRERTRKILREVDKAFDDSDPAKTWEQFQEWLAVELTDAAEKNFSWLVDRCWWVAGKVAKAFPPRRGGVMPESLIYDDISDDVGSADKPRIETYSLLQKIITALRGSYGGALMFGLITSLAGLPLINPVSVAAGVALGGKSIKDEADMRLKQRQAVAKAAAQRHVDDFFLKFSKACKDTLRLVQRQLRDHFIALAEQLQDDVVEAERAARRLALDDAADRDRRNRELNGELAKLVALHKRAQQLMLARPALPRAATREIMA